MPNADPKFDPDERMECIHCGFKAGIEWPQGGPPDPDQRPEFHVEYIPAQPPMMAVGVTLPGREATIELTCPACRAKHNRKPLSA